MLYQTDWPVNVQVVYLHDMWMVCDVHIHVLWNMEEVWKKFELMCIHVCTSKSCACSMCHYECSLTSVPVCWLYVKKTLYVVECVTSNAQLWIANQLVYCTRTPWNYSLGLTHIIRTRNKIPIWNDFDATDDFIITTFSYQKHSALPYVSRTVI